MACGVILWLALLLSACGPAAPAGDWTASVVRIEALGSFQDPTIGQAIQAGAPT